MVRQAMTDFSIDLKSNQHVAKPASKGVMPKAKPGAANLRANILFNP